MGLPEKKRFSDGQVWVGTCLSVYDLIAIKS